MDEFIARNEETRQVPSLRLGRVYHKLAEGHQEYMLRELMLQYVIRRMNHLETALTSSDWKVEPIFDQRLLLMTKMANGKTSHLHPPSKKQICNYHIHKVTPPCKKYQRIARS